MVLPEAIDPGMTGAWADAFFEQLHASHGRQALGAVRNVCGTARQGDLHPRALLLHDAVIELRARVRRIE
jgi:hypothetical protein